MFEKGALAQRKINTQEKIVGDQEKSHSGNTNHYDLIIMELPSLCQIKANSIAP